MITDASAAATSSLLVTSDASSPSLSSTASSTSSNPATAGTTQTLIASTSSSSPAPASSLPASARSPQISTPAAAPTTTTTPTWPPTPTQWCNLAIPCGSPQTFHLQTSSCDDLSNPNYASHYLGLITWTTDIAQAATPFLNGDCTLGTNGTTQGPSVRACENADRQGHPDHLYSFIEEYSDGSGRAVAVCGVEHGFLTRDILGESVFSTRSGTIQGTDNILVLGPDVRDDPYGDRGYEVFLDAIPITSSASLPSLSLVAAASTLPIA